MRDQVRYARRFFVAAAEHCVLSPNAASQHIVRDFPDPAAEYIGMKESAGDAIEARLDSCLVSPLALMNLLK